MNNKVLTTMNDENKNISKLNDNQSIVLDNNFTKFIIDDDLFSNKPNDIGLVKSIDSVLINSANFDTNKVNHEYQIDDNCYANSKTFINYTPASIPAFNGSIEQLQQFPTINDIKQQNNLNEPSCSNYQEQPSENTNNQEINDLISNEINVNLKTFNDAIKNEIDKTSIKDEVKLDEVKLDEFKLEEAKQDSSELNKNFKIADDNILASVSANTDNIKNEADNLVYHTKNLSIAFIIKLYIRQLIASPFSFSTIPNIFSKTANALGPSYPSSAGIAFLVIATIATIPCIFYDLSNNYSRSLLSIILFLCYTSLTGFDAYRGICSFVSRLSKRNADGITYAMSALMPSFVFIVTFYNLSFSTNAVVALLAFVIATVIGACFAFSLGFDVNLDPFYSNAKISLAGVIFSCLLAFIIAFSIFNYVVACIVIGISALSRLFASIYLRKIGALASKQNTYALQLIITQLIMLVLNILAHNYYLLNSYVYFYVNKLL